MSFTFREIGKPFQRHAVVDGEEKPNANNNAKAIEQPAPAGSLGCGCEGRPLSAYHPIPNTAASFRSATAILHKGYNRTDQSAFLGRVGYKYE